MLEISFVDSRLFRDNGLKGNEMCRNVHNFDPPTPRFTRSSPTPPNRVWGEREADTRETRCGGRGKAVAGGDAREG